MGQRGQRIITAIKIGSVEGKAGNPIKLFLGAIKINQVEGRSGKDLTSNKAGKNLKCRKGIGRIKSGIRLQLRFVKLGKYGIRMYKKVIRTFQPCREAGSLSAKS